MYADDNKIIVKAIASRGIPRGAWNIICVELFLFWGQIGVEDWLIVMFQKAK